ncbi:MAG: Fic family protein [Tagaea sp.]|nr:Fic family protein [Tagaea sp.]
MPPHPPLELSGLIALNDRAVLALGKLDGLSTLLPDPSLFIYQYVRKEAVLSSQIEGTQSTLADLLRSEMAARPGVPSADVAEVSRYVQAMQHGLARLREGFPLSLRLIREIHEVLMRGGRGHERSPGEFRPSQNWIGGTRPGNATFVPPSAGDLMGCLDALEKYLHDATQDLPALVKAALIHVQFESIHPFLDGNGRLGRLLVTFLLCRDGMLKEPTLYLSLYLKRHRARYYELLQRVRTHGEWEAWVRFFLEGVVETATLAAAAAQRTIALFDSDRVRIEGLGRAAGSTLRVHEKLRRNPFVSAPELVKETGLSLPTVRVSLTHLAKLGIVDEVTGRDWGKIYAYRAYLNIIQEGTEPIGDAGDDGA